MNKYDGLNKPEVTLTRAEGVEEKRAVSLSEADQTVVEGDPKKEAENAAPAPKKNRIAGLILRALSAALILGFLFLPRFLPYKGSEKVTETAKTIIMTDVTRSDNVGNGKIADFFRRLFGFSDGGNETEDRLAEEE